MDVAADSLRAPDFQKVLKEILSVMYHQTKVCDDYFMAFLISVLSQHI